MRKALVATCIVGVLAFMAGSASAQGFRSVHSKDGTDVWAVGDAGAIFRSFDGGTSWTTQTLGTKNLNGVAARGLHVWIVGDDGEVRHSTNNGGNWTLSVIPGASHLRCIDMVDASTGWIVGDNGKIFWTTDGGQNWFEQTSGTSQRLTAVRFRDTSNGWSVGTGGTVLRTTDAGTNWAPVSAGTTRDLRGVDFIGTNVWVVGNDATCKVSSDGTIFDNLDLKIDSRSNITGVWMESATNVVLTGGGGFLRKTLNGGTTWTFYKNPVLAESSDLFYTNGGTKGWLVHSKTKAISRTTDGSTWTWAGSASRSFVQKQATVSGTVRGNTLHQNGQNKNSFYVVLGVRVYKSLDRGETWSQISIISGGGTKTNAFYVSPTDSTDMVAAVGDPDRISRTTDGGLTWTTTLSVPFTEYGVPLEMNPDKPTDLYFGPEDGNLWFSGDFGATWSILSSPGFRSPCDIQVVQDNNSVIWVGDGVTGSGNGVMHRSTNGGLNFSAVYTTSGSEIPMISGSHLNPSLGLATHWSSGGVRRTTDMGATWTSVHTAGSAWGTDIAKDDPLVGVFGVYSGGTAYISLDAGASGTWQSTPFGGTNYSYYAYDRATILGMQAAGVYKMTNTYTPTTTSAQALTVTGPNGGEVWTGGETRNITWSATNVGLARIEYRKNSGSPWQLVAEVEGPAGTYAWLVPYDATTLAEIRIQDGWDAAPIDVSNAAFTILAPVLDASPLALDFGPRGTGSQSTLPIVVGNDGTAALNATIGVSGTGFSLVGSANIVVAPGGEQSVDIQFAPLVVGPHTGSVSISGNLPAGATIDLAGEGTASGQLTLDVPNGGEVWQYNTVHNIQWQANGVGLVKLEFETSPKGPWYLIADNVPATPSQYAWTIPSSRTDDARVRVTEVGGALIDESLAAFSITVPNYAANTELADCGLTSVGSSNTVEVWISNLGNAPLSVTSITDDSPVFLASTSTLTVPPLGSEPIEVRFGPTAPGEQFATFTLVSNDPASPHTFMARGDGQLPSDVGDLPTTYGLVYDGPNPFHDRTTIRYRLPERTSVTVDVYDLQGRRVAQLVNAVQGPGEFAVPFGTNLVTATGDRTGSLAAGVYFAKMQAGSFSKTHKLVLAR